MSEGTKRQGPVYTGITKYVDQPGGYAVWLSNDWRKIDMVGDHKGWIFTPYQEGYDTCFTCEKFILDYKATPEDLEDIKEGFEAGIKELQDVEIEETRYESGKMVILLEAKFTFTENGQRRKRWVKSLYWAEANLVLMAQGATLEEYEYWLPMLFNAMNTYELGIA